MRNKTGRDKVVGVRVNTTESAFLTGKAEGYGLSTPELLRVSGLLFSELLRDHNVSDRTLGRVLKALDIDDISASDVLAVLREPGLDYELQLAELLRTGSYQMLQPAS
ncbi:hypothetical protein [Mycolicibacterium mageritense]|uniref:hypothetical protein n=1 Tax=Mycolicibacterium mageritense TaxID=53462 RepID=UPI0011DA0811|nr:hypothetical protein [Mycolicibacterium mageritense]TXI62005.1 MAG: hypothetical protein E6Q55_14265 [Mycolicibacterium mageritense]